MSEFEKFDPTNSKPSHSFFSESLQMTGILMIKGDVRIDGNYKGRIESSGSVFLGNCAEFEGDICCNALVSGGLINGSIYAKEELDLQDFSRIEGEVETLSMSIGKEVVFNATCKITKTQKKTEQRQPLVRKFRKAIAHR